MDSFTFYFNLGLKHVLDWQAYDHVLFFIVLTIFYSFKDWKKVIWLVSSFTIGHMISLGLSTYNMFRVNIAIIEFLIPLTIFVTGVYNIFTLKSPPKKLGVAAMASFVFGLIHGVGFSNYFSMVVDDSENKWVQLVEFAIGIEIAQLIVVLFILLASYFVVQIFKKSKRDWVLIISAIVIGIVIPMMIERKFW